MSASPSRAALHRQLRELARCQSGVLSRAQATQRGMSSAAISRRVVSGEWVTVLPGVYRYAVLPDSQVSLTWAALLWSGEGAALSHRTALDVWGCPCPRFDLVEVTTPQRRD